MKYIHKDMTVKATYSVSPVWIDILLCWKDNKLGEVSNSHRECTNC